MKRQSKEWRFIKKCLAINPALTVSQAAHRVKILRQHIEFNSKKVYA